MPERRQHDRHEIKFDVVFATFDNEGRTRITATSLDVSESGICFSTDRYLARGEGLTLEIRIANFAPLEADAEVKHVSPGFRGYNVGVQLSSTAAAEELKRRLEAALKAQQF